MPFDVPSARDPLAHYTPMLSFTDDNGVGEGVAEAGGGAWQSCTGAEVLAQVRVVTKPGPPDIEGAI